MSGLWGNLRGTVFDGGPLGVLGLCRTSQSPPKIAIYYPYDHPSLRVPGLAIGYRLLAIGYRLSLLLTPYSSRHGSSTRTGPPVCRKSSGVWPLDYSARDTAPRGVSSCASTRQGLPEKIVINSWATGIGKRSGARISKSRSLVEVAVGRPLASSKSMLPVGP